MQGAMFWIIFAVLSLYNYGSVSFRIYTDSSTQRSCSPTTLQSLCNVTEHAVMLYACPDLDSALEYITTTNISNFRYVHICLPSGNFVLKNYWSLNISFVLTGHNGVDLFKSVIQCAAYNE